MKLHRIAIQGLLAFSDRVDLNLDLIPAGSLISVVGENGSGKSTLMDAAMASLYRTLPSRSRSIYDYALPGGGYIEAEWSSGRSIGREHAELFRLEFDPNRRSSQGVVTFNGEALTDGKVENYDKHVARKFPPLPIVLASSFAAQNGDGSFRTCDRAARKDLFAKLLGIERFQVWQGQASNRQHAEQSSLVQTRSEVARAEVMVENRKALTTYLEEGRKSDAIATALRNSVKAELDAVQNEQRIAAHTWEQVCHRRQELQRWNDQDAAFSEAIRGDASDREVHQQAKAHREIALTAAITRLRLTADIAKLVLEQPEPPLTDLKPMRDMLFTANEKELATNGIVSEKEGEWHRISKRLKNTEVLEDDAALRDHVPCEMKPPYDVCGFLAKAKQAADSLDGAPSAAHHRETLTIVETALVEARSEFAAARSAVASARTILQQAEFTRSSEATRHTAWMSDRATAQASLDTLNERIDELRAQYVEEQQLADRAINSTIERETERINRQHAHRAKKPAAVSADDYCASHKRLELADTMFESVSTRHNQAVYDAGEAAGKVRSCETELTATDGSEEELAAKSKKLTALTRDESEWQFLSYAFSRNGLAVLLIDAAGPEISELTNDLLHASFGDRFRVSLVTQTAKASGKGLKETFDLSVYDAETGGDRELTDLSGGQQVIVDEALKAALALYTARRGDHGSKTCWRDETTGALSEANVDHYISMLRRLQDLGGYDHLIYVTHSAEAATKADWTVRVANGALTVGEN